MPKTMPKTPTRHKFAAYWQTVSPTACADFPQEPWQLLEQHPDECVVRYEVDLQNVTRANVARRAGVSRAAVTQAKRRLDEHLELWRSLPAPEPPLADFSADLDTSGGLRVHVACSSGRYIVENSAPSWAEIMSADPGPPFVEGFGGLGVEDWGEQKQIRADRAHSRRNKDRGYGDKASTWARFVDDQCRAARGGVRHRYRWALGPDEYDGDACEPLVLRPNDGEELHLV